ncbi:hypothetical protein M427DRAFT_375155 [Gonapodya prolifera JEL478]|uniref:Uncharacterized protein n=1 Tax=Gonapodya prolifera (strain JEL478) TaxID=1344416 RepID=A0A139AUN4_GONPJ|nr:hypothetical protein M427DRAFT_375155 [Gonapodya prolifera JEL478]|eukprot:KXS20414.1 hypothetical protein M427DRAFT_375155 [Gonapodya prolifera JEL478]
MTDTPNPSSLPSTPTVPIPHPSPAAATRLLRPFIAAYLTTPSTPFFTRIHDNVITPALDASSAPVSFDIAALRDALNEGAEGVMGKHKQTFLGVLERCDEILGVASAKQVREGLTGDDVEDAAEKRRKALAFLGIGVPASAAATKTSEKKKKRKREVADDGEADRVDAAVVHGENVVGDGPDDRAGAQSDVNMEEAATDMQEDAHAPEPVTTAQVPVEGEAGLSDAAKKKRKRRKKKHAQALGAAAAAAGEGEGLNSDAMEDVRAESGKSETNPTPVALATPTSATTTAGAEEGVVTKAIKRAAASLRSETAPEMPESPADAVVPSDPDDAMWEDLPPPPKKGADEREATKSVQAAVAATQAAGGATAPATRLVKKGVKWVLEKNRVKTFHKALPVANFPSPIKKDAVPVKPVLKRRPGDVKVHPHVEKKGAKMKLKKGRR